MTAIGQATWDGLDGGLDGRGRAVPGHDADVFDRAAVLLAHAAVLVVGLDRRFALGATLTLPLAIVLVPLWARELRRYALARPILALSGAAIASGLVLAEIAAVDHEINPDLRQQAVGHLLSGVAALALLLWARTLLPLHRVVLLYGAGALADNVLAGALSWKYNLAVPVTFVVLGALGRGGTRLLPSVAVIALGLLGILDEGRSFFAFCLLAATLTLWQARPTRGERDAANRWAPALLMGALAVAVYLLGTNLATGGYLGTALQQRSIEQIDTSGSLLTGGRPEYAATRELVKLRPEGYGIGVVPAWEDLRAGTRGLHSVNVEVEANRQAYMFGAEIKLHSIVADLWVGYGWVGVALAAVMVIALVRSVSFLLAARAAPTSVLFAAVLALWFMFFGPIGSNWLDVCAALGIVMVTRSASRPRAGAAATW